MTQYSAREVYLLRHLKACGLSGQPFGNVVTGVPFPAADLLVALKNLEKNKLITLKGSATLADLEKAVAGAPPMDPPAVDADGQSWTCANGSIFRDSKHSADFFGTAARLTLRGHVALAFIKEHPSALSVAAKPSEARPKPPAQSAVS